MEQDDFRKLLNAGSSTVTHPAKRSRKEAFGSHRASPALVLPPRHLKGNTYKAAMKHSSTAATMATAADATKGESLRKEPSKSLLAAGYIDRTRDRGALTSASDDARIAALKSDLAAKRITHAEYLSRTADLATGDFQGSGMVRGLDRKLLERVKAGEDVLSSAQEQAQTEEALEAVLQSVPLPVSQDDTNHSPAHTDRIDDDDEEEEIKAVLSAPQPRRHRDGTTTETLFEHGRKVKIVRSAQGKVLKKLVKKDKPVTTTTTKISSPNATPTVLELDERKNDEVAECDIFSDASDYDPFAATEPVATADTGTVSRRTYFDTHENDATSAAAAITAVPTDARSFLEQNKAALEQAARLMDRQSKRDDQLRIMQQRSGAGFGLVFHGDEDAYAADTREVPEDDEMFVKKRNTKHALQQ